MTFTTEWQGRYSNGFKILCEWVLEIQKDALAAQKLKK